MMNEINTSNVIASSLTGCGKMDRTTQILSRHPDFVTEETEEEIWLHPLVARDSLLSPAHHTLALAYVTCIARFRMRTKL